MEEGLDCERGEGLGYEAAVEHYILVEYVPESFQTIFAAKPGVPSGQSCGG
jgi:hypothetical protein